MELPEPAPPRGPRKLSSGFHSRGNTARLMYPFSKCSSHPCSKQWKYTRECGRLGSNLYSFLEKPGSPRKSVLGPACWTQLLPTLAIWTVASWHLPASSGLLIDVRQCLGGWKEGTQTTFHSQNLPHTRGHCPCAM